MQNANHNPAPASLDGSVPQRKAGKQNQKSGLDRQKEEQTVINPEACALHSLVEPEVTWGSNCSREIDNKKEFIKKMWIPSFFRHIKRHISLEHGGEGRWWWDQEVVSAP